MKITIELDKTRTVTSFIPISAFAALVEAELAERGIIRKAVQQVIQNYFKPANSDKPNWFAETHIRIMGGKKMSGYVLLPVELVGEYAEYLVGGAK